MARCGGALTDHAERINLCAYRWLGRRAYDFITRANRRRPQLGLSLLLAARCRVDLARVTARGLSRGSHIVAPVAVARHRGQPGTNANNLWRARRTPSRRV